MRIEQIRAFFLDKENAPCPITEELIKAGYQQERGGYIAKAKALGKEVDYKKAKPTQWWHLIESYCNNEKPDKIFPYSIRCGELYFWMAEVSGAFTDKQLRELKEEAIGACIQVKRRNDKLPPLRTSKGNVIIRKACYNKIKKIIEDAERND